MPIWRGRPPSASGNTGNACVHEFKEVRAGGESQTLHGWHCHKCGQLRKLRLCARCSAEYGIEIAPGADRKLCPPCEVLHKAKYAGPSKPKHGKSRGGDNRR